MDIDDVNSLERRRPSSPRHADTADTSVRGVSLKLGSPYCDACGYDLVGQTDSTRCPECGRPLVEVLMRAKLASRRHRRYTSPRRVFGMPLVQINTGPGKGDRFGKAVAFIAIGNYARGVVAMGNVCVGVVAIGNLAIGLISVGSLALGGIALGAIGMGAVALGGMAFYVYHGFGGMVMNVWPW